MEELQARLGELLGYLTPEITQGVYEQWIEKLQQVIHTDGEYI
jgi:glycine cleavage system protein P-like pyridoxal-binding family